MTNFLGKITNAAIKGLNRVITMSLFTPKDAFSPLEYSPAGIDSCPVYGVQSGAAYFTTSNTSQPITGLYLNSNAKAAPGETRIYHTNTDGTFRYNIWLRNGEVLIGDSQTPAAYTNFLTKFNELQTGFNELRNDFNTFISVYNSHIHAGVTTGGGSSGPTPNSGTASAASIDNSKADTIKVI